MSKKGKKDKQGKKAKVAKKMSNKAYLKELEKLEAELVHLQSWVIEKGPQGGHRLRRP
jgi:polyphosphate kinase 2 (PPK2 family)